MDTESIKAFLATSLEYADGDLWKFLLTQNHRIIHKWIHYFPIYEEWFGRYKKMGGGVVTI